MQDPTPLPHDLKKGRAVIAELLRTPGLVDSVWHRMDMDDFAILDHKKIYAAIIELLWIGGPINARSVRAHLSMRGEIGTLPELSEVAI